MSRTSDESLKTSNSTSSKTGALLVAAGMLLSKTAGLARESVFAHYFGSSDAGDAYKAALKIPNFLQNLLGEGVLSASFIPVYTGLRVQGEDQKEDAKKVARTIASLLSLVVATLVLLGVLATPALIDLVAPGFHGEKRELTIRLVQIIFPGTGILVLSAWCLGILNSHHKFFMSYAAPVLSNFAVIATLFIFGGSLSQNNLAITTAWGLVIGSLLQLGIQLPTAFRLISGYRPTLALHLAPVRTIVTNFVPVVISRGVVQVSAYIDSVLASFLPTGAVSALAYAQMIYLLPIGLFGMSISAAELPNMSRASGSTEEIATFLRGRLNRALRQIAFFVIPSSVAFLFLGDVIISALLQTGKFTHETTLYVWAVLAGSTVGLLSATFGRIYSSTYYALKDTRTPLRFSLVRVALTTVLGILFSITLPKLLGIGAIWATAGLTISAGIAGWAEFLLLRRGIRHRLGPTGIPVSVQAKLWGSAIAAAIVGGALKLSLPNLNHIFRAAVVLIPFGIVYLSATVSLQIPEASSLIKRLLRRA